MIKLVLHVYAGNSQSRSCMYEHTHIWSYLIHTIVTIEHSSQLPNSEVLTAVLTERILDAEHSWVFAKWFQLEGRHSYARDNCTLIIYWPCGCGVHEALFMSNVGTFSIFDCCYLQMQQSHWYLQLPPSVKLLEKC